MRKELKGKNRVTIIPVVLITCLLAGCGSKNDEIATTPDVAKETAETVADKADAEKESEADLQNEEDNSAKEESDENSDAKDSDAKDSDVKAIELYTENIAESDYEWDEAAGRDIKYAHMDINLVRMEPDIAKEYPKLNAALEELAESAKARAYEMYQRYDEDARQYYDSEGEDWMGEEFYDARWRVVRSDSVIVSLLQKVDVYAGGAHDEDSYYSYTFDSKTGKELGFADVVTDTETLHKRLLDAVYATYPDIDFFDLEPTLDSYFEMNGPLTWTLGREGLTFYFSPYEIAAFNYGLLTVNLSYEENADIIKEEYMNGVFGDN